MKTGMNKQVRTCSARIDQQCPEEKERTGRQQTGEKKEHENIEPDLKGQNSQVLKNSGEKTGTLFSKESEVSLRNPLQWMKWIADLQSIAQAGLFYGRDVFDLERYEQLRSISAAMMADLAELPLDSVKDLFCMGTGYQTPKLDTRAAIFKQDRILLVQEKDGRWSLPGGWVDYDLSIKENTVKEAREEAGMEIRADSIIAIHDRARHNLPVYPYGVTKVFVLCSLLGGCFTPNNETIATGWFDRNHIPEMADPKNTREQVELCFKAYDAKKQGQNWEVEFD